MAAIRKRGVSWVAEIVRVGVPRQSKSFARRADALKWATAREAEIDAGKRGVILPHTVAEAFTRYAAEVSPTKKGARWEQVRLKKLGGGSKDRKGACGFVGMELAQLRTSDIAAWRDAALKAGLSASSVRREMNLVRSVLERCRREWGWLTVNPMQGIHKPPEGRARDRRVSDAEIAALLAVCGWDGEELAERSSQRVAVAVLWAVETAMRAGEIIGLSWSDIDVAARFAKLPKTKNGDERKVPLSTAALRLLAFLPNGGTVFGLSSGTLDVLFRRARDRAGLVNVHFHDLRAEALTRMARKVDVLTLARIAGHRDIRSLTIYYRESASDIAARLD